MNSSSFKKIMKRNGSSTKSEVSCRHFWRIMLVLWIDKVIWVRHWHAGISIGRWKWRRLRKWRSKAGILRIRRGLWNRKWVIRNVESRGSTISKIRNVRGIQSQRTHLRRILLGRLGRYRRRCKDICRSLRAERFRLENRNWSWRNCIETAICGWSWSDASHRGWDYRYKRRLVVRMGRIWRNSSGGNRRRKRMRKCRKKRVRMLRIVNIRW